MGKDEKVWVGNAIATSPSEEMQWRYSRPVPIVHFVITPSLHA